MLLPLALPLVLASCRKLDDDPSYGGMTSQDFIDQYSAAWCEQTLTCLPGAYADLDDCLANYDEAWGDFGMYADECHLVGTRAQGCLDAIYASSCDDLFSSYALPVECEGVWQC